MFNFIRKHQTWLMFFIAVTVITFLFWGSSATRLSGNSNSGNYDFGTIEGQPVTREAFLNTQTDSRLMLLVNRGEWIASEADAQRLGVSLEQETYQRLFLAKRAKDMGIRASEEQIGRLAGQILTAFGGKQGPVPLEEFEKQILAPHQLTRADFRRALESQSLIQELVAVVGGNGKLVTPQEAEATLRREAEEIATVGVFFHATNYLVQVAVTPEAIAGFYTNQLAAYRQPDRRQVSYLKFAAADFLAEADKKIATETNLNLQIDRVYESRGSNYFAGKTAAEAKLEIRADYRRGLALRSARDVAAKFADQLLTVTPVTPGNLDKLAADQKLTVEISSPFSAAKPPVELNVNAAFCRAAFALTDEEPFAGPIPAEEAVYVIALKKLIPSGVPALDTIHDQVAADYKLTTAVKLAQSAGQDFAAKLNASAGKKFEDVCAEAKLKPVTFPAFSLLTRALPEAEPHLAFGLLQNLAMGLAVGSHTGFRPTDHGGVVICASARTPADDAKIKTLLPGFIAQSRQARQSELFNLWFQREAQTALRETPLMRRTK